MSDIENQFENIIQYIKDNPEKVKDAWDSVNKNTNSGGMTNAEFLNSNDMLSTIFEDNGDLLDEFRRYPTPQEDGTITTWVDKSVSGSWYERVNQWQDQNLDRIPDWEKIIKYLNFIYLK